MKKIILLCALVILAIIVAACTPAVTTSSGTTTGSTTKATTTASATTTTAANTYEPKTLKILGSVNELYWETLDDQPAWAMMQNMLAEINLTLELEAIPSEQYQQVLQTRTATAFDLPDMVNVHNLSVPAIIDLGISGIFQDVKPLVEAYSNGNINKLISEYFPNLWSYALAEDGKAYFYPQMYKITYEKTKAFSSVFAPLIRGDWLEKLNISRPTTADEFVNALVAMRDMDANGNGDADEVLIFTPSFWVFAPFFGLPGDYLAVDIYDHTVKSPWLMKDKLVEYIGFLQTLVNEGVLDTSALDKPGEYVQQKLQANQVSCQVGYANTTFYSDSVKEFSGRYEPVIFKGGSSSDYYISSELPEFVFGKIAITKECKDPEAAVRLLDLTSTPEFALFHRQGIEGQHYTIKDGVIVPDENLNRRDWILEGNAIGLNLWHNLIGQLSIEQAETLRLPFVNNPVVIDFHDRVSRDAYKYYYGRGFQLSVPTNEESDRELELWPDLSTYMREAVTKLALGQYKIEDIDTYIDQMKELGLEEMIAIDQARHNRFIGK